MADSPCHLNIELADSETPVVVATESLRGTVRVEVDERLDCEELVVRRFWQTDGRGEPDVGGEHLVELFEGTWEPGESYEYSFEMPLPAGPVSYEGHFFDLRWHLRAEADLSGAGEATDGREFELEPGGSGPYIAGEIDEASFEQRRPEERGIAWRRVAFGAGLVAFAAAVAAIGTMVVGGDGAVGPVAVVGLALVLVAAGGWIAYTGVRNVLAVRKLGDVQVELSPARVTPGEELAGRISMDPPGSVRLEQITWVLRSAEQVSYEKTRGEGRTRTLKHVLHEQKAVPEEPKSVDLEGDRSPSFEVRFTIPEEGDYTFESADNEVTWEVGVHVAVANWPDWNHSERVMVRPRPADGDAQATTTNTADEAHADAW